MPSSPQDAAVLRPSEIVPHGRGGGRTLPRAIRTFVEAGETRSVDPERR